MDILDPVADELIDALEPLEPAFEPLILPLDDWLTRALGLFASTLGAILDTPVLRFLAVFGVFCVAVGLCQRLIRTGKALS